MSLDIGLFLATFYHAYVTYEQETFGRLIDFSLLRGHSMSLLPIFFIVTYDIEHLAPLRGLDLKDQRSTIIEPWMAVFHYFWHSSL